MSNYSKNLNSGGFFKNYDVPAFSNASKIF